MFPPSYSYTWNIKGLAGCVLHLELCCPMLATCSSGRLTLPGLVPSLSDSRFLFLCLDSSSLMLCLYVCIN